MVATKTQQNVCIKVIANTMERRITKMTTEQYFELIKIKHSQTDWNSLASIKAYNEYVRQLRSLLEYSKED